MGKNKPKRKDRWFAHAVYKRFVSPFINGVVNNSIKSAEERIQSYVDKRIQSVRDKQTPQPWGSKTINQIVKEEVSSALRVPKESSWGEEEMETLDRKFDALCEYLSVEFVDEKISDGSKWGDKTRFYCRKKKK